MFATLGLKSDGAKSDEQGGSAVNPILTDWFLSLKWHTYAA